MAKPTSATNLFVQDVQKNLEYFTQTLGFTEVERTLTPDQQIAHAVVQFGKGSTTSIGLVPAGMVTNQPPGEEYDFGTFGQNVANSPQTLGNGVILFFQVPNVDKFYAKIQANGAIIDEPPTDQMWGQRTISVLTPDNYYLTFFTPIKGWKPQGGMQVIKPKLSTAQRNQRKYAGKMTSIRARAHQTKRGKGRIANRPAAKKARRDLGVGQN
jgi:catechol 2,3-dioxygenase-like lactoylglutathione lyase family enzyme